MKKFLLFFHTIRYLKLSQIYWRIFYLIRNRFFVIKLHNETFKINQNINKHIDFMKVTTTYFSNNKFSFLNIEMDFLGWENKNAQTLWLYNLHYFEFILQSNIDGNYWIDKWIKENPPLKTIGWQPYPLSLRVINLIKYHYKINELSELQIESLNLQVSALERQIEYHILGNHLFENGKSLFIAGLFLSRDKSMKTGLKILNEQIKEQIQDDGSHFELSPMYHAIILEGLLDIINFSRKFSFNYPGWWNTKIESMLSFYRGCLHKDNKISYFNDSVLGISKDSKDIFEYAKCLGFEVDKIDPKNYYINSGLVRFENNDRLILIDGGPIGPDYIPGHAHADNLSFELSNNKTRIIVNSGISTYERNLRRVEERSTVSHNTVVIDGKNQSQVWASFRVGKRVYPKNIRVEKNSRFELFRGSYTGGSHHREIKFLDEKVILRDTLKNSNEKGESYLHFHPNVLPTIASSNKISLKLKDGTFICNLIIKSNHFELLDYKWAKGFNLLKPSKLVKIKIDKENINEVIFDFNEKKS